MNTAKPNQTRIVRVDPHNVAVEVYREITNKTTKETRMEWQEQGYYGGNLIYAAQSALYNSLPIGEPVTPNLIKECCATIVEAFKKVNP